MVAGIFQIVLLALGLFLKKLDRDGKFSDSFHKWLEHYSSDLATRSAEGKTRWRELMAKMLKAKK